MAMQTDIELNVSFFEVNEIMASGCPLVANLSEASCWSFSHPLWNKSGGGIKGCAFFLVFRTSSMMTPVVGGLNWTRLGRTDSKLREKPNWTHSQKQTIVKHFRAQTICGTRCSGKSNVRACSRASNFAQVFSCDFGKRGCPSLARLFPKYF